MPSQLSNLSIRISSTDKLIENVQENTINRRLDVTSTIFTQARKEWGWAVDNPVLSICRPKNPSQETEE